MFFFSGHIDLYSESATGIHSCHWMLFGKHFPRPKLAAMLCGEQQKQAAFLCLDFFELVPWYSLVFWMCLISLLKASFIELTALLAKWHGMLGHEILTSKFRFATFARVFFNQGNHCQSSQLSWLDRANSAKSYSSISGTREMWWEFHGRDDGHYKVRCQFSRRITYRIVLRKMWIWVKTLKKAFHLISKLWSLLEYDQRQHWITTGHVVTSHGWTWSTCFNTSEA